MRLLNVALDRFQITFLVAKGAFYLLLSGIMSPLLRAFSSVFDTVCLPIIVLNALSLYIFQKSQLLRHVINKLLLNISWWKAMPNLGFYYVICIFWNYRFDVHVICDPYYVADILRGSLCLIPTHSPQSTWNMQKINKNCRLCDVLIHIQWFG